MMLRPLSPGQHEVVFGGSIPTNEYPVLSDFSSEMTYVLNVVEAPPATMIGPEARTGLVKLVRECGAS